MKITRRLTRLDMFPYNGRILKGEDLRTKVEKLLGGLKPAHAVIALTYVYTGTADFVDAEDAKAKMRQWVGVNNSFHPHVANHDFEAWLLPYWDDIKRIAGHNRAPKGLPETVNHKRPPSHHIQEILPVGTCRDHYSKPRDANRLTLSCGKPI